MASLEIKSQTFIPQVKILRSEMVLAHVSGTSMPGPKPDPPAPAPCPSLHFQFLGKAVQSSSGILLLPGSCSLPFPPLPVSWQGCPVLLWNSPPPLLPLPVSAQTPDPGPGAIPDSSSAGLALTVSTGVLSTRTRLWTRSPETGQAAFGIHAVYLCLILAKASQDQDRIDWLLDYL